MSVQQLLILLVIVALIFGTRQLRGGADRLSREVRDAVQRRMPVYSAETTRGKEAEFIRDKLPKRFPTVLVVALAVLCVAAAWWLTRATG